jgi:hypothetical protein
VGGEARVGHAALAGIEVDDHPIRLVQRWNAAQPDVRGDAALVGHVDQGRGVIAQHMGDGAAHLGHCHALHPFRKVRWHVLLVEDLRIDVLADTLHAHRPTAQVGNHPRRHAPIVLDDLAFGDAGAREHHAIGVGDRY